MKKLILIMLLLNLSFAYSSDKAKVAVDFMNLVNSGKYDEASKLSSPNMKTFLSEEKIKEFWLSLESRFGKPLSFGQPEPQKSTKDQIYLMKLYFKSDSLNARIMIDSLNQVSGLLFLPIAKDYKFDLPGYVDTTRFSEIDLEFGIEGWKLPAKLTVPRFTKKSPALVLVHGSGPNDMDVTVGGIKVFRDIAYGLTSNGIAVFRYEKRTKEHPSKFVKNVNKFTVWEETIEDAIEAVKFLKTRPEIDPNRIYVLGHSLGGHLAPRIAKEYSEFAGIIIANGNARKLHKLVPEQYEYIFGLDGDINDIEKVQLERVTWQAKLLDDNKITPSTSKDSLPFGLPANYWIDLNNYDAVATAKKVTMPIFIINSGKDYQVTKTDYDLWVNGLSAQKNVTTRFFSSLNHLFIHSAEMAVPTDYEKSGTVDEAFIISISDWILKRK